METRAFVPFKTAHSLLLASCSRSLEALWTDKTEDTLYSGVPTVTAMLEPMMSLEVVVKVSYEKLIATMLLTKTAFSKTTAQRKFPMLNILLRFKLRKAYTSTRTDREDNVSGDVSGRRVRLRAEIVGTKIRTV